MIRRVHPVLEWGLLLIVAPFLLFSTVQVAATLAALLALVIFWLASAVRKHPWPETPFNGALLVFEIAVGVGILVTVWPELTLSKATGLVLGLGLFRAMASLRGHRGWRWNVSVLMGLGIGITVAGTLSARFYAKIPLVAPLISRLPARLLILPESPEGGVSANQLAGVLAFYLPLALSMVTAASIRLVRRTKTSRCSSESRLRAWGIVTDVGLLLTALVFLVATGVLLLATQSRSGWIGAIAGALVLLVLVLWSTRKNWLRWLVVGTLALLLVGGGVFLARLPAETWARLWGDAVVTETEFAGRVSFSGRVEVWSRALHTIQDFPFTGCGLGTLRKVVPLLYPSFIMSPAKDIAHAHNIVLQTATDVGVPGLVAYLGLLGIAAVAAWKAGPQRGLPLLAALVALHVYGLTDAIALGSKPGIIWWAVLGLLAMLGTDSETEPSLKVSHD